MANWTIRSINGKKLPRLPLSVKHTYITIDKDSARNLNGDLIRNIVGKKNKFELSFSYLNDYWFDQLVQHFKPDELVIEYEDFFDNSIKKATFYHGDLVKEPYLINLNRVDDRGKSYSKIFKDFKVSIIQH